MDGTRWQDEQCRRHGWHGDMGGMDSRWRRLWPVRFGPELSAADEGEVISALLLITYSPSSPSTSSLLYLCLHTGAFSAYFNYLA